MRNFLIEAKPGKPAPSKMHTQLLDQLVHSVAVGAQGVCGGGAKSIRNIVVVQPNHIAIN